MASYFFIEVSDDLKSFRVCGIDESYADFYPKDWNNLKSGFWFDKCENKKELLESVKSNIRWYYNTAEFYWESEKEYIVDVDASISRLMFLLNSMKKNPERRKKYIEDIEFTIYPNLEI